jgi:hypothetical protein
MLTVSLKLTESTLVRLTTTARPKERVVQQDQKPLVICYISGLDMRRIDPNTTKFLAEQFNQSPWRGYVNLPSNELFPTLVTGVDPTVHGVWGVQITDDLPEALAPRLSDRVPDSLTTAIQCALHFVTGNYDLAAIPPRRRRRFNITRTKYKRRIKRTDALYRIGSIPTVLGIVGSGRAQFLFTSDEDPTKSVMKSLCREDKLLEILELYSLDRYQQWNLHDEHRVDQAYKKVDRFLELLMAKCERFGKALMILSDHGHQSISRSFDMRDYFGQLNLSENEYTHFVEVSSARFWFHSDHARKQIHTALQEIQGAELVPFEQMSQYGIPLKDSTFGELFCFLPPGSIFFPHDFYQPLANLYFGLTDRMQRSRLTDPRHRGNHGHLPHHDAEGSFVLVHGSDIRIRDDNRASILDIAPSILSLLDFPIPDFMPGRSLFERV